VDGMGGGATEVSMLGVLGLALGVALEGVGPWDFLVGFGADFVGGG